MRTMLSMLAAGLLAAAAQAQAPLQKPATKMAPVTQAAGGGKPVVVNGCGSCANADSAAHKNRHWGGTVNPVGCGCWASERTFFWGGCKQFFTPQNTCGNGCCGNGLDRFHNKCDLPQYGNGLGQPANNCAGPFSYIMR